MITQSSATATTPSKQQGFTHRIAFLDNERIVDVWKKAIEERTLQDVSQFFTGLNDDERTLLLMCGIYNKRFRRRTNAPLRSIVDFLLIGNPDWTESRAMAAIANLQANNILMESDTELLLTRFITPEGCFVRRPKAKKGPSKIAIRNQYLMNRFEGRCAYCRRVIPKGKVTCDHVIPKSRGGADEYSNMALCCKPCNTMKGARTPEQWARDILHWNLPTRTKPRSFAMSCLAVAPAFALSWLATVLSFAKGGVR